MPAPKDMQPEAFTDDERIANRRQQAAIAFEMQPQPKRTAYIDRCDCDCTSFQDGRCRDCGEPHRFDGPDNNSAEAVEARRAMFEGFGWGVTR